MGRKREEIKRLEGRDEEDRERGRECQAIQPTE